MPSSSKLPQPCGTVIATGTQFPSFKTRMNGGSNQLAPPERFMKEMGITPFLHGLDKFFEREKEEQ
jgi:hypothetical protein